VFLKLRSGVQEKGRGFWKINNSILQELEYQTLINHLIDKHIENSKNNQIDIRLVWDALKIERRRHINCYAFSFKSLQISINLLLFLEL
jgi:hypothetical protein